MTSNLPESPLFSSSLCGIVEGRLRGRSVKALWGPFHLTRPLRSVAQKAALGRTLGLSPRPWQAEASAWPVQSRGAGGTPPQAEGAASGWLHRALRPLAASSRRLNRDATPGCSLEPPGSYQKPLVPGPHLITVEGGSLGVWVWLRCFVRVSQLFRRAARLKPLPSRRPGVEKLTLGSTFSMRISTKTSQTSSAYLKI